MRQPCLPLDNHSAFLVSKALAEARFHRKGCSASLVSLLTILPFPRWAWAEVAANTTSSSGSAGPTGCCFTSWTSTAAFSSTTSTVTAAASAASTASTGTLRTSSSRRSWHSSQGGCSLKLRKNGNSGGKKWTFLRKIWCEFVPGKIELKSCTDKLWRCCCMDVSGKIANKMFFVTSSSLYFTTFVWLTLLKVPWLLLQKNNFLTKIQNCLKLQLNWSKRFMHNLLFIMQAPNLPRGQVNR